MLSTLANVGEVSTTGSDRPEFGNWKATNAENLGRGRLDRTDDVGADLV
jgi:hypothetical protein